MTTQTKTTWRKVKLGEVADVQWGDTNTTKAAYKPSGYTAFSATGPDGFMDHYDFDREGVVLSAIGANCGETWFTRGKWSSIKNTIVFWGKQGKADTKFLFYKTHNKRLWPIRGSAQPFISQGDAREMELLIPESPIDQKHIANILSTLDDKFELNNKINRTLEQMAQAIFKEWFVNFRFPGHEKAEFIDSPLGRIPKGWEVRKMLDVCDQIVNGGTPRREVKEYWEDADIPWVTTAELQDQVVLDTKEKISEAGLENSSTKLLPINTVVIALYASPTLGRLGLLRKEATTNQACSALIVKEDIGYGYLFYWLLNQRQYLQGIAVGAAQQNISQAVIRDSNVLVPNKATLNKFNEFINYHFDMRTELQQENQTLAALRDLLLSKLMSGAIRV